VQHKDERVVSYITGRLSSPGSRMEEALGLPVEVERARLLLLVLGLLFSVLIGLWPTSSTALQQRTITLNPCRRTHHHSRKSSVVGMSGNTFFMPRSYNYRLA